MAEPVVPLTTSFDSGPPQKPKEHSLGNLRGRQKSSGRQESQDISTVVQKTTLVPPEEAIPNLENTPSNSAAIDEEHKQHSLSLDQVANQPTTEIGGDVAQHAHGDSEPSKECEGLAETPSKTYLLSSSTDNVREDRRAPLVQRVKTRLFSPKRNAAQPMTTPSISQPAIPSSASPPSEVKLGGAKDQREESAIPAIHPIPVVVNEGEERTARRASMARGMMQGAKKLAATARPRRKGSKVDVPAPPSSISNQNPPQLPARPEEKDVQVTVPPPVEGKGCDPKFPTTSTTTQRAITSSEPPSSNIQHDGQDQSEKSAFQGTRSSPAVIDSEKEKQIGRRTSGIRSMLPRAGGSKLRRRRRIDKPDLPTSISDQGPHQQPVEPEDDSAQVTVPLRNEGNQYNPEGLATTSNTTGLVMTRSEPSSLGIVSRDGKDQSDRLAVHETHSSSIVVNNEEEKGIPQRTSRVRSMIAGAKKFKIGSVTSATRPGRKGLGVNEPASPSSTADQALPQQTKEPEEKNAVMTEPFHAEGDQSGPAEARNAEQSARESEEVKRLQSRISELEKRCEAQSRDLESSNSFLNATDKSSDSDVINVLRRLNAEVQQSTTLMAECLAEDFEFHNVVASPTKVQISSAQTVSETIGGVLANSLGTKPPEYIPMLLQVAFQAYLASALGQTASSWAFEPAHNKFITTIYQSLRAAEAQAVSGRWRSLARFHIVHSWVSHLDELVKGIIMAFSYILLAAGCTAPQSEIISTMTSKFEQKVSLLVELAGRLNRVFDEIISSDFEVLVVQPGVKFESKDMEDADDDHVGVQDALVLCATNLGLIKRIPVGTLWEKGKKQKMMVLKPKVLLESFLDAED